MVWQISLCRTGPRSWAHGVALRVYEPHRVPGKGNTLHGGAHYLARGTTRGTATFLGVSAPWSSTLSLHRRSIISLAESES
jgi:hypothetical protein